MGSIFFPSNFVCVNRCVLGFLSAFSFVSIFFFFSGSNVSRVIIDDIKTLRGGVFCCCCVDSFLPLILVIFLAVAVVVIAVRYRWMNEFRTNYVSIGDNTKTYHNSSFHVECDKDYHNDNKYRGGGRLCLGWGARPHSIPFLFISAFNTILNERQ